MNLRLAAAFALISGLGVATGCASSNSPGLVQALIGPGGGTISNDGTTVVIPPGALTSSTAITITPAPNNPPPPGTTLVGTPMILGPDGQTFIVPVSITMEFDPGKVPAGHATSEIAIYTAPVGITSFNVLGTTLADGTHVSAQTAHFSIFMPAVATPENGTTGGATTGGTTGKTATTGKSTTTGKPGTTGEGATSTGSAGGTTGGTTGATTGGTTGGTSGGTSGTTGGGDAGICSATQDCVGLSGCMALNITSTPTTNTCTDGFLDSSSTTASIALGGFHTPQGQATEPSIDLATGQWTLQIDLPCCPAEPGTLAISAFFDWTGGLNCPGVPTADGTVSFESVDGGLTGTLTLSNGPFSAAGTVAATFSFPDTGNPGYCDAGSAPVPPVVEDAGASCSAALDCLGVDAGALSGTGTFWLNPTASLSGSWCQGPLFGEVSSAAIGLATAPAASAESPTVTVDFDDSISGLAGDGLWRIQAFLPCCPAGAGSLVAQDIELYSLCGGVGNSEVSVVTGGTGTVTFTQTDGGLVGSIHLDGATEAEATFSLP